MGEQQQGLGQGPGKEQEAANSLKKVNTELQTFLKTQTKETINQMTVMVTLDKAGLADAILTENRKTSIALVVGAEPVMTIITSEFRAGVEKTRRAGETQMTAPTYMKVVSEAARLITEKIKNGSSPSAIAFIAE